MPGLWQLCSEDRLMVTRQLGVGTLLTCAGMLAGGRWPSETQGFGTAMGWRHRRCPLWHPVHMHFPFSHSPLLPFPLRQVLRPLNASTPGRTFPQRPGSEPAWLPEPKGLALARRCRDGSGQYVCNRSWAFSGLMLPLCLSSEHKGSGKLAASCHGGFERQPSHTHVGRSQALLPCRIHVHVSESQVNCTKQWPNP